MSETIKGFKGFNKDMTCRGKRYEENTTYEENGTDFVVLVSCTFARIRGMC